MVWLTVYMKVIVPSVLQPAVLGSEGRKDHHTGLCCSSACLSFVTMWIHPQKITVHQVCMSPKGCTFKKWNRSLAVTSPAVSVFVSAE